MKKIFIQPHFTQLSSAIHCLCGGGLLRVSHFLCCSLSLCLSRISWQKTRKKGLPMWLANREPMDLDLFFFVFFFPSILSSTSPSSSLSLAWTKLSTKRDKAERERERKRLIDTIKINISRSRSRSRLTLLFVVCCGKGQQ